MESRSNGEEELGNDDNLLTIHFPRCISILYIESNDEAEICMSVLQIKDRRKNKSGPMSEGLLR